MVMEVQPPHQNQEIGVTKPSILLEFAALDDLPTFRTLIEDHGIDINELGLWYTRRIGSRTLSYEQRTPLMVAASYGSFNVLNYILTSAKVDVDRIAGSDCVSALHCAVAAGSYSSSPKIVELLIQSSADVNSVDGNGNKAVDLIPPPLPGNLSSTKKLQVLLSGGGGEGYGIDEEIVIDKAQFGSFLPQSLNEGSEKKEYPVDTSLPDINNGIYGSDEFRMYSFKIKPCSRAYTHDWTECPFSHPGENARRRDPRKYQYSCVPCPEFRKNGACKKGDDCEYAHGVFESWLHPAQYRTRLCKDEVGCSRRVCFFAHKKEELRPVYASTGSAIPAPNTNSTSGGSPVSGSSAAADHMATTGISRQFSSTGMSTPPMSPTSFGGSSLSPKSGGSKINGAPNLPSLQLPGSRLRSTLSARDVDMELELLKLEKQFNQQQQMQLLDGIYGARMGNELNHNNSLMSCSSPMPQSPVGLQMHHYPHLNHIRTSYPPQTGSSLSSSPVARKLSPPRDLGSPNSRSAAAAAAMLNDCRAAAFAKRSQSFIDRGVGSMTASSRHGNFANSTMSANPADYWCPPDGKLDWGIQGQDMNMSSKLRKSASFGFRGGNVPQNYNINYNTAVAGKPAVVSSMHSAAALDEPDVSWVSSLVKDVPPPYGEAGRVHGSPTQKYGGGGNGNGSGSGGSGGSPWAEQLYIDQEQMVAY